MRTIDDENSAGAQDDGADAALRASLAQTLGLAPERVAEFSDETALFGSLPELDSMAVATLLTAVIALTTAIRPHPWYDAHYAVPLAGIMLGNILNAASLALDSMLGGVVQEKAAIEAQLMLGASFRHAVHGLIRTSLRRALLPIVNQMSAAGIITLPGIMTGQILAGMDPLEAAKYQVVLMFLLSGGGGLAAVVVVYLAAVRLTDDRQRLRLDRLNAKGT